MLNSQLRFNDAVSNVRNQGALHEFLHTHLGPPSEYDDLLRLEIVFAVSAFDKLIHDLIRVGMVEIYKGNRLPTPRYLAETLSLNIHAQISSATVPPKEIIFEQEIVRKLRTNSYQDPDKVAEGLSYIWSEPHKWQAIAARMNRDHNLVRTQLKLIATRRNAIVHEADRDPITHSQNNLSKQEADDIVDFIHLCGNSIVNLVI